MKKGSYKKFGLMMVLSFVIMYAVMFFNVDRMDHIMLSNTRLYMTLLMVAPMAIVMLSFMWAMYENKKIKTTIMLLSLAVFIGVFYMLRNQMLISDIQYMKAMIPHHSSAIMVSQKANLKDPETIQLSKEIIEAQEREIAQMKKIIERLEEE